MKLTVQTVVLKDVRMGGKTEFIDSVMHISKSDVMALIDDEPAIPDMKVDIIKPGESCRVINLVDIIQPRCKVEGNSDWPGVLSGDFEIAGCGTTRAVEGLGIVLCQNNCIWKGYTGMLDMTGAHTDNTPFSTMPHIVIEPLAPETDFRDYREALRRIGLRLSIMIAQATLATAADKTEVFDNGSHTPGLPNVAYSYQIYSKQYDTENYREPMFYGQAVPDSLPLVVRPTEALDGAISSCGGYRGMLTYEIQNHPVVSELFRRHGKELNFVGTIITVTAVESIRRQLAAAMAANILKEVMRADGVIVTKAHGGASTICVGAIASECEKIGIGAVPVIQVLNAQSNLSTECLFDDPRVDSIVQTGCYFHEESYPDVDKVYGGSQVFTDMRVSCRAYEGMHPANKAFDIICNKHAGVTSQVGGGNIIAVDY